MSDASVQSRLGLTRALQFSAVSVPLGVLGLAMAVTLPRYFTQDRGVSAATVGLAFFIVRMIDIPVDILLAAFMDRTKTALGRYRVWFLVGIPLLLAGVWALYNTQIPFSLTYLVIWLLIYYLATSIIGLSHSAWAAKLSPHYDDRSRLFAVLSAVGVLGAMIGIGIPIVAPAMHIADGAVVATMGFISIGLLAPAALSVALIREPIEPDRPDEPFRLSDYTSLLLKPDLLRMFLAQMALTLGPGWMSAMYLFYFTGPRGFTESQSYLLLGLYILAGLVGAPLTGRAAIRFGKHRTLMVTTTLYSLGLLSVIVLPPGNMLAASIPMVLLGAFAAGFDLMIRAMLADVGDEVRLEQGRERISMIYSVNTLAGKIAAAFSIVLSYGLLERVGYHTARGAVNSAQGMHNLELIYIIGPIVFVMLGGACVIGWRLDARKHGEIRAQLERIDREIYETGQAPVLDTLEGPPHARTPTAAE